MQVALVVLFAVLGPDLGASPHAAENGADLYAEDSSSRWSHGSDRAEFSRIRWTLNVDNDLLAGARDRDYTGGFSATMTGRRAQTLAAPNYEVLNWLDEKSGISEVHRAPTAAMQQDAVQIGLLAFTPEDIENPEPMENDRPYASLLFLAHSHYGLNPTETVMYQSTFSVGLLGTSLAERLQRLLHEAFGGSPPAGYRHQISDGGELTARYAVARHALLRSSRTRHASYDLKLSLEGSIGYLTDAAVAIGLRWGRISSPWWSSVSESAEYAGQPAPDAARPRASAGEGDFYLSAGVKLRARLYNAFLQGQFRDSRVTLDADDLHTTLMEAWLGLTREFRGGLEVSYLLRYQTPEIRRGAGARSLAWAGVTIAKHFG